MREIISLAAKWIIKYLEISNYLYVRTLGVLGKERVYNSEEQYWRDILGPVFYKGALKNPQVGIGDVVVLKNFQLSPWHPYQPGLYWTYDGHGLHESIQSEITHSGTLGFHFKPHIKRQLILRSGFGSIRTRTHKLLSMYGATTSGNLNAAIPVLVTSNVKGRLLRFSKKTPLVEVDLRGLVMPIPSTYSTYLHGRHVPKICLLVNSILNVKRYISDFSLTASAWTIYHNSKSKGANKYGYTFAHFNPIDESSIVAATDWIDNYISDYTKGRGIAITDYDEITPRFNTAVLPLKDIMEGNVDYDVLNSLFRGVDFRQPCCPEQQLYR